MANAVKVQGTGKAKPKIVRVDTPKRGPVLNYEPDLIRVRALERGYYAVREAVKHPGTGRMVIERPAIIRNAGEVFDMDTGDMRVVGPDGQLGEIPPDGIGGRNGETKDDHREKPQRNPYGGNITIETERGQFELPYWVELAEEVEDVSAEMGHKTSFGKKDGDVL